MAGDHLSARQNAVPVLAQHRLTLDGGDLYDRADVTTPTWPQREAASTIQLPRQGKTGCYLSDVSLMPYQAQHYDTTTGVTVECVFATTTNNFNFLGGLWERSITYYLGPYSFYIGINYGAVNDSISDTAGRALARVYDVGQDRIASRTVHSRPVITDGAQHHLALTHAGSPTLTNAVKLYVDGVLVETCTLKSGAAMFTLEANCFNAGVTAYFTQPEGSISHACLTPQVLPQAEILARANLVQSTSGLNTSAQLLAWNSAASRWETRVMGYAGTAWKPVKKP